MVYKFNKFVIWFALAACFSLVKGESRFDKKLKYISESIEKNKVAAQDLNKENLLLSTQIQQQDAKIKHLKVSQDDISKQIAFCNSRLKKTSLDMVKTEERTQEVEKKLHARARALYLSRLHHSNMFEVYFQRKNIDAVKFGYFMSKIQLKDLLLLRRLRALKTANAEQGRALQQEQSNQAALLVNLYKEKEKEKHLLQSQQALLKTLQTKEKVVQQTANNLKKEYAKVEKVIESITAGYLATKGSAGLGSGVASLPASTRRSVAKNNGELHNKGGLSRYVKWPVSGKVVKSYGEYRVSTFDDIAFHKGLLFLTQTRAPVKALDKGTVRFLGDMPRYGLVLILDHGNRDYTLYGKLSEVDVQLNSYITKDAHIGYTTKQNNTQGVFYFEIRRAGKTVDPFTIVNSKK
jgi:septal ring factor EnvC (AmiA/AmiB activator)